MQWTLYLRLIVLTAGTLLPFFWMVVILGHRRQRNFERIFFFLCLALTLFFGCSLLELNAKLYYEVPPQELVRFAWTFLCVGLWFLPPLILHLHLEYANLRGLLSVIRSYRWTVIAAYLPVVFVSPKFVAALGGGAVMDFDHPTRVLGPLYLTYLVTAVVMAAFWQYRFAKAAPDEPQRKFHSGLTWNLGYVALLLSMLMVAQRYMPDYPAEIFTFPIFMVAVAPLWEMLRGVQRFNFLQIGRQRNLIYAVFGIFLALLYLSFVRRASQWLEPYLPPAASAALLLFLPIVFFEPLQRIVRQSLKHTAQTEVDRAQKLMGPISEVARLGNQEKLRTFAECWIAEQLQLAEVKLELQTDTGLSYAIVAKSSAEEVFLIGRAGQFIGRLRVRGYGAMISGETYAALEFLCEQLPGAFDLCRLIEEKLQLERELAERERLALVGQMAASISHNLKNPLGSIKTILQVQMESPELPASLRQETQMVLEEINRLSARLNQLLQFSRPGVRAGNGAQSCDLAQVAETVANMLRHAAEERRVSLKLSTTNGQTLAAIGEEAANDILSNVVLNAIEAVADGGHVRVALRADGKICNVFVEDDGPGISAADQAKVLQPFLQPRRVEPGWGWRLLTVGCRKRAAQWKSRAR
jgi:signal transduction histidine kinase